jgi:DNA polymerase III subunit alpha
MPTGAAAGRSDAAEGHDPVRPEEGSRPRVAGTAAPGAPSRSAGAPPLPPEPRPDRGGRPAAPARGRRDPSGGRQLGLVGGGAAPRPAPPAVTAGPAPAARAAPTVRPARAGHPAPLGRDPGRSAPASVALPPGLQGRGGRRKAAPARESSR